MQKMKIGERHTARGLDDLDFRILDAIQRNPPLSTADLAEKVGMSQSPCWRRLTRLKEAGYIRDEITRLDAKRLGFGITIFASVKLTAHGRANLNEFSEAINRFPEVLEAYAVMGQYDFLLRIITPDVDAYHQFVYGRLSTLPTVQEISSTIAMVEVKASTVLPLRCL